MMKTENGALRRRILKRPGKTPIILSAQVWDFVFIHIQVMEISRLIPRAIPIVRVQGKW